MTAYRYRYESDTSLKLSFLLFLNSKTAFYMFFGHNRLRFETIVKDEEKNYSFQELFCLVFIVLLQTVFRYRCCIL